MGRSKALKKIANKCVSKEWKVNQEFQSHTQHTRITQKQHKNNTKATQKQYLDHKGHALHGIHDIIVQRGDTAGRADSLRIGHQSKRSGQSGAGVHRPGIFENLAAHL